MAGDINGLLDNRAPSAEPPDYSCASPLSHLVRKCDVLETQILASTVRLQRHVWRQRGDSNWYEPVEARVGHATITEGQYLVTHNHSAISRSDPGSGMLTTVSVYTANVEPLWLEAPGVFWNGYHIANTWARESVHNVHSGAILRRYSVAALNSSRVVAELP